MGTLIIGMAGRSRVMTFVGFVVLVVGVRSQDEPPSPSPSPTPTPSEPAGVDTPKIMARLAKVESRFAIAEMVWRKRVADVTSDPEKAESAEYQKKLDDAETELAEAQLDLETEQRKGKVAEDTKSEMRAAQATIRKDSKQKVAELRAEKTVLDERNAVLLARVQGLTQEQHEMDQTRKQGVLGTEISIRQAVGGMAKQMQRDSQLKDQVVVTEDKLTGLAEQDANAKAGVEAAAEVQKALEAAGVRFTELGKEKSAKMKALKPPSFIGDSQSGRWYDVQEQGVCLDFCRPIDKVWTCTLAGSVQVNSTDYKEADFPICESKGAKSMAAAGRYLVKLDQKLDQQMEVVTKLNAMAQATDYHQLQFEQVEAAGYLGATLIKKSLLEHTEDKVAAMLAKEREQLESRVSDQDRIAALEDQVKELEARKKKQAKQIRALERALKVASNDRASLRQKVDANHLLEDVGLPFDKLDIED